MKDYSLVIYKADRRYKHGETLLTTYAYEAKDLKWMHEEIQKLHSGLYPKGWYRIELHETWKEKKNVLTGETFQERFDTPYFCSPSSESYWAN